MNVYKHTLDKILSFFFFTKTCMPKSLKIVSFFKWTHERQRKSFRKVLFIFCIFVYIYIFFSLTPAYDMVPRTEAACDPQNWSRMLSPQLTSHVVPRTAICMWSPPMTSHVVSRTAICMWSPPMTSHVVPTNDITCGPHQWHHMWSPPMTSHVVPRTKSKSQQLLSVTETHRRLPCP